jgi:hypothetical protein
LLRLSDEDEEEFLDEEGESEEWDGDAEPADGTVSLSGLADVDTEDEESEE